MRDLQSRTDLAAELRFAEMFAGLSARSHRCRYRVIHPARQKDNINGTKEDIVHIHLQNNGCHCVSRNHESHCNDLTAREGVGLAATVALTTQTLERHQGSQRPK